MQMVQYFNDVASWVATTILVETHVRNRAKVMDIFIHIAQALKEMNNFHLVTAITSAFNTSTLLRLKWTVEKLPKRSKQILEELEELMNVQSSFKNYRLAIEEVEPPCIPYMGVYLTDLTFIDEGNPHKIAGRINFSKCLYSHKVISTALKFKPFIYNFAPVQIIQQFFLSARKIQNEDELYTLSLEREPRSCSRNDIL